jgi:outer membrane beta-barrel protein
MKQKSFLALLVVALWMSPFAARAQSEPSEEEADLIEKVAVRNRLYTPKGRLELGASVGLTFVPRLTDHYNFNGAVAYNFSDTFGAELRGGYAYSRHTGLANQVAEHLLQRDPQREVPVTDDLSNLWEMKLNAILGARWAPIYGKISLLSEVPVHFQTYLWAGLGGGTFHRESVVMCLQVESRTDGRCAKFVQDDKMAVIFSGALGFRFFTHQNGGIKLEVRSWMFPDSYRQNLDRREVEKGTLSACREGEQIEGPLSECRPVGAGLTNLVLFDLGYSFLF